MPPRLPPEKAEEVLAELERVLDSSLFRGSRRCRTLLRCITEKTIAGDFDSLKERALGMEVFGRPVDYDTSQDPVVRASAAEIRKKLAQYYQEAGHETETRIELPSGSYLAEFHFIEDKPPAPVALPTRSPRRWTAMVIASVSAVSLILTVVLAAVSWHRSDLDDLWGPVMKAPGTVLVCIGIQAAYNLRSAQAQDEIQGVVEQPGGPAIHRSIQADDLILLRDR